MTQHLAALDSLTASFYHAHCSTILRPNDEALIPRTPDARRLINIACTSWKLGIEQMMRTSKLITTHKPRTGPSSSGAMLHRKYAAVTVNKNGMITPRRFYSIVDGGTMHGTTKTNVCNVGLARCEVRRVTKFGFVAS